MRRHAIYLVSGHFVFQSAHVQEARGLMHKIMTLGRTEPGVIRYAFRPDWDDPARYSLYEEWESKAAHDAHFNSDAMQAMVPRFFELLAGAPDVTYYDAIVESRLGD